MQGTTSVDPAVVLNEEKLPLPILRQRSVPLNDVEVAEGEQHEVGKDQEALVAGSTDEPITPANPKGSVLELETLLVLADRVVFEELLFRAEIYSAKFLVPHIALFKTAVEECAVL